VFTAMPDDNPKAGSEPDDHSYDSLASSSAEEREIEAKKTIEWIERNKRLYGPVSKEEHKKELKALKKVINYKYRYPSEAIKLIIKLIIKGILGVFVLATILLPVYLLYSIVTHLIEWLFKK
jgi:hypothetical protein